MQDLSRHDASQLTGGESMSATNTVSQAPPVDSAPGSESEATRADDIRPTDPSITGTDFDGRYYDRPGGLVHGEDGGHANGEWENVSGQRKHWR